MSSTLIVVFIPQQSSALDYHFTAAINNNYNNVGNWTIGYHGSTATTLPNDTDNIVLGDTTADFNLILNKSDTINNLTIEGSGEIFIDRSSLMSTYSIFVKGTLTSTNDNSTGGGTGFIRFIGNSNQYLYGNTSASGLGKLCNIIIDKSGGTLVLYDYITLGGISEIKLLNGTLDPGTSSVSLYYMNQTYGALTFYNLEFWGTGGKGFIIHDDITVLNKLSLIERSSIKIDSSVIDVEGSLLIENTYERFVQGNSTINLTGTDDQLIQTSNNHIGVCYLPNISINKTGGTLSIEGTLSVCGNWENNFSSENINGSHGELYFFRNSGTINIGGSHSTPIGKFIVGGDSTYTVNIQTDSAIWISKSLDFVGTDDFTLSGHSIYNEGDILSENSNSSTSISSLIRLTGEQEQNLAGSFPLKLSNLYIRKTTGSFTLSDTLLISNELRMGIGNIISSSDYPLIMLDNATMYNAGISGVIASDDSHIEGIMHKRGNDVFLFPVGKNGTYNPIGISAPSSTSDVFIAEYFDEPSTTTNFNSSLTFIDPCEYWNLEQDGSSSVNITLGWDNPCFHIASLSYFKVARDSSSKWVSAIGGSTTGTTTTGTITTTSARSTWGNVTLAKTNPLVIANAGSDTAICNGQTVTLGGSPTASGGTGTKTYSWSPSTGLSSITIANPVASLTDSVEYTLTVTDAIGEFTVDNISVFVADTLVADAGFGFLLCQGQSSYLGNGQSFPVVKFLLFMTGKVLDHQLLQQSQIHI